MEDQDYALVLAEVKRFKQSVIQNENIDEVVIPQPDSFIQHVADDANHDIPTLMEKIMTMDQER